MRYINKTPSIDINMKNKMINEGWKQLKEPSNIVMATLISLPIALLNVYICLIFISGINPNIKMVINSIIESGSINFKIKLTYIIYAYICILLHEIIHMILIPNFIKSKLTFISIKLWRGFVYTEEIIKKRRHLIITIMPFIILSFIVPFFMTIIGISSEYVFILAIINSAGACVDIMSFIIILFIKII